MNHEARFAFQLSKVARSNEYDNMSSDELIEMLKTSGVDLAGISGRMEAVKKNLDKVVRKPVVTQVHAPTNPPAISANEQRPGVIKQSAVDALRVADSWGRELAKMASDPVKSVSRVADAVSKLKGPATKALDWAKSLDHKQRAALGAVTLGTLGAVTAPDERDENGNRKKKWLKHGLVAAGVGAAGGALSHPEGRKWAGDKLQAGQKWVSENNPLKAKEKTSGNAAVLKSVGSIGAHFAAPLAVTAVGSGIRNGLRAVRKEGGGRISQTPWTNAAAGVQGLGKMSSVRVAVMEEQLKTASFLRGMVGARNALRAVAKPALNFIQKSPQTTLALAGGAAGLGKHMMSPKDPQTGQRQGNLVANVGGGVMLGMGAKQMVSGALQNKNIRGAVYGGWKGKGTASSALAAAHTPPPLPQPTAVPAVSAPAP
jgi:hypothetical protein